MVAAKKRPKKSNKSSAALRPVTNKKSLNGFGALEPIVCAYFSTVFRPSVRREAWGNATAHWLDEPKATLDSDDILENASKFETERGASYSVSGTTFLVARGHKHSLLISIQNDMDWVLESFALKPLPHSRRLTIGSLHTKIMEDILHVDYGGIKMERGNFQCQMFVTKSLPKPIAHSDIRKWNLITNSGGKRGWELSGSESDGLDVDYSMLLLHAYINSSHQIWATGSDTDLLEELVNEIDISAINLEGHDMKEARLDSTNLSHADFNSANLSHADLSYADLSHANLPDGLGRFK